MTEHRAIDAGGATEADLLRVVGETVMSLGTDVVFVVDATTLRLVQANRAFTRILGYGPEEIPTLSLHVLGASDRSVIEANLAKLSATGASVGLGPLRRKDGSVCEMEVSVGTAVVRGRTVYCAVAQDLTDRREAERARRDSETRLRTFVDAAFEGLAITDNGRIVDANARVADLLRAPLADLVGRSVMDFIAPESRVGVAAHFASGAPQFYEHMCLRTDGTIVPVEVQAKTIEIGGRMLRVTAVRDTSARKILEEQVRLAQRMESVGRLAGGVAHDFNNLLTVILSLVGFLAAGSRSPSDQEDLGQIQLAAERAAELTQQLLAFARRQIVEPKVLDLNDLVSNVDKLLRRLIGEDIQLATIVASPVCRIRADPGKIEQVLVNLAVNARDAMASGGKLTIETANIELGEEHAIQQPEVTPGSYVMLSVTDTGTGMDSQTMAHIFEPFFTTKAPAKGTGLGLATCYGIVKQSGGSIWADSEVGRGTTFKVVFPRVAEALSEIAKAVTVPAPSGRETLLVVEDDEMVRRLAVRILRAKGYLVHETGDSAHAIDMFEKLGRAVDLLIADVVMAGMSGKELADRLRARRADLKVLYTSGYTEDTIVHHGVVDTSVYLLPKPYLPEDLARRVREVLDRPV